MTGAAASASLEALSAMRDPAFYGLPAAEQVTVRETHASLVFLAGDRAYKVKKAVRLPFLDYGTLELRRRFCLEEVRLNRPYAPRTYIGVRAVVLAGGGFALGEEDDPGAVEYAVEMRRLDEGSTLERLVRAGRVDERLIERIGRRIAEVHAMAPVAPPEDGSTAAVWAPVEENFEALHRHARAVLDPDEVAAAARQAQAFIVANAALVEERAAAGRVRDCHGDLRAEHVVVENGLLLVDRVEFGERFRHIDVAADLAFLVMDLERLGAPGLADALTRAYVAASGDAGVLDLLPFYASYRAGVRAKVACARLDQLGPHAPERDRLVEEARTLLGLALRFAWRSRLPLALVFCGVAGSGKSTLAIEVARRAGLRRLSSDEVRKRLAGVAADARAGTELYSDEHTERTYADLVHESAEALRADDGVVVDATFHMRSRREALTHQLSATGARVLFCECRAPAEVLERRGRARELAPEHGSDATPEVIAVQREAFEPLDEVPPRDHLVIDTSGPLDASLAALEALVSDAVD